MEEQLPHHYHDVLVGGSHWKLSRTSLSSQYQLRHQQCHTENTSFCKSFGSVQVSGGPTGGASISETNTYPVSQWDTAFYALASVSSLFTQPAPQGRQSRSSCCNANWIIMEDLSQSMAVQLWDMIHRHIPNKPVLACA